MLQLWCVNTTWHKTIPNPPPPRTYTSTQKKDDGESARSSDVQLTHLIVQSYGRYTETEIQLPLKSSRFQCLSRIFLTGWCGRASSHQKTRSNTHDRHCGLVVSAPAWDGTGCEFDSWQCWIYIYIYIPCSLSLRLQLGPFGFSVYI